MRVGAPIPLTLLLLAISTADAIRTRKAGASLLRRINGLITEQVTKSLPQFDSPSPPPPEVNRKAKKHVDELSLNEPDGFFQGDVELSDQQALALEQDLLRELGRTPNSNRNNTKNSDNNSNDNSERSGRGKRKVGRETVYKRWDVRRPISFEFADAIPGPTRQRIRDALQLWQRNTCVRFLEDGPDLDRIEFYDGGGCSSFVGRAGGTQGISIATPGCDVAGIIAHEVGHALGTFHEQARPDQERHIRVHYDNIPVARWNNFYPVGGEQADLLGLPYDAGSVMHYGATGFAVNPYHATISTLDPHLQQTIGQRAGPSFLDFQAINKAYHCYDHCPPIPCQNGGYPNPHNCSKCKCPSGFAGEHCTRVQFSVCGAQLKASTQKLQIESPNYPNGFPQGMDCNWLIQAPKGAKLHLQFVEAFDFECIETCDRSYVEVKVREDMRLTGYRYCCGQAPLQTLVSESDQMVVLHRGLGESSAGFRAQVWADRDPDPPPPKASAGPLFTLGPPSSTFVPERVTPPSTSSTERSTDPTEVATTVTASTARPTSPTPTSTSPSTTTSGFGVLPGEVDKWLGGALGPENGVSGADGAAEAAEEEVELANLTPPPTAPPAAGASTAEPAEAECACGPWSAWTGPCSQACGGCGRRTRARPCRAERCRREERRACNWDACPRGTNFLWTNGEFHFLFDGCCLGAFNDGRGRCSGLEREGGGGVVQLLLHWLQADHLNATDTRPPP